MEMRSEPYAWFVEPDGNTKRPLCYEVQSPFFGGRTVAWISDWAGSEEWHIQLFEDGVPGKATGSYASARDAFDILQKQLQSKE